MSSAEIIRLQGVYLDDLRPELEAALAALLGEGRPTRVLDAGCGRQTWLELPASAHVVGLDMSAQEMAENPRIDEHLVGDVQTYPLPQQSFDAAICWWVLEHVPEPERAVANLAQSLRSGGALLLVVPNIWSMKAILTKLTPHRFHLWVYRRLFRKGAEHADESDPFKTYLRGSLAPDRLTQIAISNGCELVYGRLCSNETAEWLPPLPQAAWRGWCRVVRAASFGRYEPELEELVLLLRKV